MSELWTLGISNVDVIQLKKLEKGSRPTRLDSIFPRHGGEWVLLFLSGVTGQSYLAQQSVPNLDLDGRHRHTIIMFDCCSFFRSMRMIYFLSVWVVKNITKLPIMLCSLAQRIVHKLIPLFTSSISLSSNLRRMNFVSVKKQLLSPINQLNGLLDLDLTLIAQSVTSGLECQPESQHNEKV